MTMNVAQTIAAYYRTSPFPHTIFIVVNIRTGDVVSWSTSLRMMRKKRETQQMPTDCIITRVAPMKDKVP